MVTKLTERLLSAVETALPAPNEPDLPPREIARRTEGYALTTVRAHALPELVRQGRAIFDGPDCQRRYRRPA